VGGSLLAVPGASPGLHPTRGPAPVLSQPVPGLQDYSGIGILVIFSNLFLVPALAYILPGAQLQYSANHFRGSRIIQVSCGGFIISKLVLGASPGLHPTRGPAPVPSQPVPGLQDYSGILWGVHY
jgi:hypothetical protein